MITCTAYGPAGPAVYLATTEDFRSVERHGIVRQPGGQERRAAAAADRRQVGALPPAEDRVRRASRGEILLSRSADLVSWSAPEQVLQPRDGAWWDSLRIGIGPPPLRTEHGWLLIYHGVKETVAGGIYRVGLALLDLDEPTRVLRRLPEWILGPLAPYEREGDVPNVVFPCGLVHDDGDRRDPALLRRRRHVDLPRHGAARRSARSRARRARLAAAPRSDVERACCASRRRASRSRRSFSVFWAGFLSTFFGFC